MKTFKLTYYFYNNESKVMEMTVKAADVIEAKQIGAKKINRKFHNEVFFCWKGFEVLD